MRGQCLDLPPCLFNDFHLLCPNCDRDMLMKRLQFRKNPRSEHDLAMGPSLALYQPDQAANVGTLLRLGACLDVPVHVIEPCGFPFSVKALKRSGLDYLDHATIHRHDDWDKFVDAAPGRIILLTTKADRPYTHMTFQPGDSLLLGQESAGAPPHVHERADARLSIPMQQGMRSLNIAVAAAMVLGEALRQLRWPAPAENEEEQR